MAELRAQTTQQPRGRPKASARWDGTQWVLDPDATEQAAKKLVAHRITCRDRKRATRALLKQMKPALFEKKTQTTLDARVHTVQDHVVGSIKDSCNIRILQPILQPDTQHKSL